MNATIFETWDNARWAAEVEKWSAQLPDKYRQAIDLLYRDGLTHEVAAERMQRQPLDMVVFSVVGIRLIQEHLQREYATIEPPWPRRGSGVPGAPVPKQKDVVAALKSLGRHHSAA